MITNSTNWKVLAWICRIFRIASLMPKTTQCNSIISLNSRRAVSTNPCSLKNSTNNKPGNKETIVKILLISTILKAKSWVNLWFRKNKLEILKSHNSISSKDRNKNNRNLWRIWMNSQTSLRRWIVRCCPTNPSRMHRNKSSKNNRVC